MHGCHAAQHDKTTAGRARCCAVLWPEGIPQPAQPVGGRSATQRLHTSLLGWERWEHGSLRHQYCPPRQPP
eukprot:252169-Prymnesium_polylepis.1